MNLLKRFGAWIVKIISGAAAIIGAIIAIVGLAEDQSEYITYGLIIFAFGFIVCGLAVKFGNKAKTKAKKNKYNACKSCGSPYSGAHFSYKYNVAKGKRALSGLLKVPVDIRLTCPNCGKDRMLYEYVEIADGDGRENSYVEEQVQNMMNEYCN